MTQVFLSYSRADESQAGRLYHSLCDYGLSVWFDKESLLPGQTWEEEIKQEIRRSDFVILLLSKKSVGTRGFFQKELRFALDVLGTIPLGHVYLLPVRVDECEIPSQVATIHYIDLFPNWDRSLAKLCKSIELQSEIQSRAKATETQRRRTEVIRLLLVNDQPATMNFAIDLWKSSGITVDYAFDVPQAINAIEQSSYHVIVSDLSHFSHAGLITDRAAFEILEWAQASGKDVNVIISTADVSAERQKLAQELGAIGICNTLKDLNDLLATTTGLYIDYPPEFAAVEIERDSPLDNRGAVPLKDTPSGGARNRLHVFISCSQADREFVTRLARDLERHGIDAWLNLDSLAGGETWASPITRMIREADVMLAIVSRHWVESPWFKREVYEGIARERDAESTFVVPLAIDDNAVTNMPYFIRDRMYVDFRDDYEKALAELLRSLNALTS